MNTQKTRTTSFIYTPLLLLVLAMLLSACSPKTNTTGTPPSADTTTPAPALADTSAIQAEKVTSAIWDIASQLLVLQAQQFSLLDNELTELVKNPSQQQLQRAQEQWHNSYQVFMQLSPLLYLSSKYHPELASLRQWRATIAPWPIQPGYIDYYGNYRYSGIIHAIAIPLTATGIRRQHGLTQKEDVLLGLHAIEYLLWGEKGSRLFDDFNAVMQLPDTIADPTITVDALPNNRRRQLLLLQSKLLLQDSKKLHHLWQPKQPIGLAFLQIPATHRLTAINESVSYFLQQWALFLIAEDSGILESNESINAYAAQRHIALEKAVGTIKRIYFDAPTQLATLLLPPEMQTALKNTLDIAQQELIKNTQASLNDSSAQLLQAVTLLSNNEELTR